MFEAKKVLPSMDKSKLMNYFICSQKWVLFKRIMSMLKQKFFNSIKIGNLIEKAIKSWEIESSDNSSDYLQLQSFTRGISRRNKETYLLWYCNTQYLNSSNHLKFSKTKFCKYWITNHIMPTISCQITLNLELMHIKIQHDNVY